jgi:hypothetical protein
MARQTTRLADGSEPEKVIQKRILDWLKTTDTVYWRQNSGLVFVGRRRINLGEEGLPDIVVIVGPNGRMLGLEVKSASGALRPSQRAFMASLEAVGGTYKVVRSLAEAKNALAEVKGALN